MIKTFSESKQAGHLDKFMRKGVISTKYKLWMEIYYNYDKNIIIGMTKPNAITQTAGDFNISERTVRRAIELMISD